MAWHRIGDLLCEIPRKLLHVALLRYVDEYLGPESLETMEHCLDVVARLSRCILAGDAVAVDTLMCGATLWILGVQVHPRSSAFAHRAFIFAGHASRGWLGFHLGERGGSKMAGCDKDTVIATTYLDSGSAQKLSGMFGASLHLLCPTRDLVPGAQVGNLLSPRQSAD